MQDFIVREEDSAISCTFSSTLDNVDKAVESIKFFFSSREIHCRQFELIYILREALNNAVIHGNKKNSALKVSCTIGVDQNVVSITVTDQGKGFDWREQIMKGPVSTDSSSGRGLKSMAHFGFEIRFNDSGNTLYLTKKII
ncbi:MAG: ATP-binding protein [Deltaproteobacteria bacterium]|nr:ATP-binding protein [Deltaproteobacteria bacterium]